MDAVVSALDELTANSREVVTLRDIEGSTAPEVCALLEISKSDQSVLLHAGRSRVRAACTPVWHTCGVAAALTHAPGFLPADGGQGNLVNTLTASSAVNL